MKMTIEIPADVLAEVMALTGRATKREAVEFALREAARRAQQHRLFREGLGLSAEELAADAAPKPADLIDAPDIDEDAVAAAGARFIARQARRAQLGRDGLNVNEPPASS